MRSSPLQPSPRRSRSSPQGARAQERAARARSDGAAQVVPPTRSRSSPRARTSPSSAWHGARRVRAEAGERLDGRAAAALAGGRGRRRGASRRQDRRVRAADGRREAEGVRAEARLASSASLGDWTAVARDDATLDMVANAKTHLADNARFVEAMGRLPGGALVRAYANGDAGGTLLASIPGQLESRLIPQGARYRLRPDRPGLRTAVGVGTRAVPLARGRAHVDLAAGSSSRRSRRPTGSPRRGRRGSPCSRSRRTRRRSPTRSRPACSRSSTSSAAGRVRARCRSCRRALKDALRPERVRRSRTSSTRCSAARRRSTCGRRCRCPRSRSSRSRPTPPRRRRRSTTCSRRAPKDSMLAKREAPPGRDRRPVRRLDDAEGDRRLPRRRREALGRPGVPRGPKQAGHADQTTGFAYANVKALLPLLGPRRREAARTACRRSAALIAFGGANRT